ncbi:hypothetical protein [Arthrobacter sp. Helios]|uniref:hypothetical protein n=1 Tax=Arthrobacter sp. Helios TaxID=2828862 RepID=UPI00205D4F5A|nr:hypothetical protein [Arthrobacter sp. Helios]UPO76862.1 hypothetical protein ArtHe_16300 [Arthrobacter sp. Helios]
MTHERPDFSAASGWDKRSLSAALVLTGQGKCWTAGGLKELRHLSVPQPDDGMKNWVRLHPYLALASGYVIFFVFTAAVRFSINSRDLVDALVGAFIYTSVYWVFALSQVRTAWKTKKRLAEHGQFKAYIRYPDSRPGSLSGIWNQGIATPAAGSVRFQPAVYDTLEPSGRATDFVVLDVFPDRWKVSGKERKYLPASGYQAMTLLTDKGKVQLAASPESLDGLATALASGPV